MRTAFRRTTRRLERAVLGGAMVALAWFLERKLIRAIGRRTA